ncbi:hypothetical protein QOZ75_29550, partial [Pseudomonas aeruginosa]|uniref:hypothetical protein n=1 Tax=Pseudomonas aeruginosa TaxID=287 RepID=UPI003459913F
VLALLGQETHRSIAAIFPFSIEQQSIASMLITPASWGVLASLLTVMTWLKYRTSSVVLA